MIVQVMVALIARASSVTRAGNWRYAGERGREEIQGGPRGLHLLGQSHLIKMQMNLPISESSFQRLRYKHAQRWASYVAAHM